MTATVQRLNAALPDRYRVERLLGRGGMGTVFLATDEQHGREVAIKVLHQELATAVAAAGFLREIRITAKLRHPNILALFDSGEADGFLYYVMPFIDGESLAERLDREGVLPIDVALQIAAKVAGALDHAHAQGVIHRDVKPANILLEGDHVYIADFGVARALSDAGGERITATGHSVGTPAYMSPEQASGEDRIDGRTDVYSLGCVLYQMLTGEPPFTGRTARAVIVRHLTETPSPVELLRPGVSSALSEAVARGLAKVPADRPATATEFVHACRTTEPPPPGRGRGPRGRMAATTATLAAVALVALGIRWLGDRTPQLDPNKVVVFPLVPSSSIQEPGAGWDVALAIGAALEHTEPLKWIDAWTWLPVEIREDAAAITADLANDLALDRRARHYIAGGIRGDGDSITVVLRLHDALGDSIITQESATGTAGMPLADVALDAVVPVLAQLIDPGRAVDLTPLTDRAAGAVALSIQGDREYRRSQFGLAQDFYERALEADSSLAFAAVKGAQAASWNSAFDDAASLIAVARHHRNVLPSKYRHFADGLDAYLSGAADSAAARFERALAIDPEWAEAFAALGEVYLHLLPSEIAADSLATSAFRTASRLDAEFTPPLVHLVEARVRGGELDSAASTLERLRGMESDTILIRSLELLLACAEDPARFSWTAPVEHSSQAALMAAAQFPPHDPGRCGEGAFEAVITADLPLDYRWTAMKAYQGLLIAQGRHEEAARLVQSFVDDGVGRAHAVFILGHLAGAPFRQQASRAVDQLLTARSTPGRTLPPDLLWLLGAWLARHGDALDAAEIAAELRTWADSVGDPTARLMADAAQAHATLASADTLGAIARLRSLTPNAPRNFLVFGDFEPLAVERMLLAELLLAQGDYGDAYEVASIFDHPAPVAYLPFLPRSLAIRERASRALGDSERMAEAGMRLRALGWRESPSLIP